MSTAYSTVVGGKLKLKGKSAPVVRSSASAVSGVKRPRSDDAPLSSTASASSDLHRSDAGLVPSSTLLSDPSNAISKQHTNVHGGAEVPDVHRSEMGEAPAHRPSGSSGHLTSAEASDAGAGATNTHMRKDTSSLIKASADGLTPAQRAREEALRKREKELVSKMVAKSHREKVDALNSQLSTMPEHNDIPKISYAGIG